MLAAPSRAYRALLRWVTVWAAASLLLLATPASAQSASPPPGDGHVVAAGGAGDAPLHAPDALIPPPPATFNTWDGGWIRVRYEPSARQRVQPLLDRASATKSRLEALLGRPVLGRVVVVVARTPGEMAGLVPNGVHAPRWASGLAFSSLGYVLLTLEPPFPGSRHELVETFDHELAHVALHDAVAGRPVPRWFNEGFAMHAADENRFARVQTLWSATLADRLFTLEELERGFPDRPGETDLAYAQAADVVRFLLRGEDQQRFHQLIARVGRGEGFDGALGDAYGTTTSALEHEWRTEVARRYSFWPVFFGGGFLWFGVVVLFGVAWRRRQRRQRERLAAWAEEEAREDRERQRAVLAREQALRVRILLPEERAPSAPAPHELEVPKVQHDGSWHTLH